MDPSDFLQAKQAPTILGDSKEEQGSKFISYAVKVTKVEDVRAAYRKLRIKYADASHIISAHRLSPPNGPLNQEATDDGEHAGGRLLLHLLQDLDIVNVAVFIVRYFGGTHIGNLRFEIMENLAKVALRKAGFTKPSPRGPLTRSRSMRETQAQSLPLVPNGSGSWILIFCRLQMKICRLLLDLSWQLILQHLTRKHLKL